MLHLVLSTTNLWTDTILYVSKDIITYLYLPFMCITIIAFIVKFRGLPKRLWDIFTLVIQIFYFIHTIDYVILYDKWLLQQHMLGLVFRTNRYTKGTQLSSTLKYRVCAKEDLTCNLRCYWSPLLGLTLYNILQHLH